MTDLHWSTEEFEWVAQVRQVLLDLARACLGDNPVVPMPLAQKAIPLANQARELLDRARDCGIPEANWTRYPSLNWTERSRSLFLEIAELYLSDSPSIPDNLSERTLELSQQAQEILDNPNRACTSDVAEVEVSTVVAGDAAGDGELAGAATGQTSGDRAHDIDAQLVALHRSIKQAWGANPDANVREWQQLLALTEVMQDIHARLPSGPAS